jgi:hypothetical protein
VALRWAEDVGAFLEEQKSTVDGAGPRAQLIPHDVGVTALDPDSGSIVQVGTDTPEVVTEVTDLTAPLAVATFSPAKLVPFAAPVSSTVVVVRDGRVSSLDTSLLGCRTPDAPVVYSEKIYVACRGAAKVIVLDGTGRPVSEFATPRGGDPVLLPARGKLVVNVPGASTGLVVDQTGRVRTIRTNDPDVPVRSPSARPSNNNANRGGGNPQRMTPGARPSRTTAPPGAGRPPSSATSGPAVAATSTTTQPPPPPPPPDSTPTSVEAIELSTGNVRVNWVPGPGTISSYRILLANSNGMVLATVSGTLATALANTRAYVDQPIELIVEAVTPTGSYQSAPSNTVWPYVEPPPCRQRIECEIP